MAEIRIVVKDKKNGRVSLTAEFYPRIKSNKDLTSAQAFGLGVVMAARELAEEHGLAGDGREDDDE